MTTIKKGTILRRKENDYYAKVLAITEDLVFLSRSRSIKDYVFEMNWGDDYCTLNHITEKYDIVEEDWKAEDLKADDDYWYVNAYREICPSSWENDSIDIWRRKTKNVFPTREKAQEYKDKIMNS